MKKKPSPKLLAARARAWKIFQLKGIIQQAKQMDEVEIEIAAEFALKKMKNASK